MDGICNKNFSLNVAKNFAENVISGVIFVQMVFLCAQVLWSFCKAVHESNQAKVTLVVLIAFVRYLKANLARINSLKLTQKDLYSVHLIERSFIDEKTKLKALKSE